MVGPRVRVMMALEGGWAVWLRRWKTCSGTRGAIAALTKSFEPERKRQARAKTDIA